MEMTNVLLISANSTRAFSVESGSATPYLAVDTTNDTLTINGTTTHTGNMTLTGDLTHTGTLAITGNLTIAVSSGVGFTLTGTPSKVLSAGSYSSKIALASGATTEMVTIAGEGSEDDFYIGYGSYISCTGEDGKGFGLATLVEAKHTTGTKTLQGGQMIAFLGTVGGSEAAHLKTRGGDTTAGMFGLWLKIGANENCVMDSGSLAACIWLDNSMSGTKSGTRYSAFISAGSISDAVFGFAGTGAWTNFIEADSDAYNRAPFNGGGLNTDGVDSDGSIVMDLNGTTYYIPYFAASALV